jgi:hypothetical protein
MSGEEVNKMIHIVKKNNNLLKNLIQNNKSLSVKNLVKMYSKKNIKSNQPKTRVWKIGGRTNVRPNNIMALGQKSTNQNIKNLKARSSLKINNHSTKPKRNPSENFRGFNLEPFNRTRPSNLPGVRRESTEIRPVYSKTDRRRK